MIRFIRFPGNRYLGQPLDRSSRRSIRLLHRSQSAKNNSPELISREDRSVVIDNFYHEGTFWEAVIPLDGVADVSGQAFNFSKARTRQGLNGPETICDQDGIPKRTIPWLNHLQCRFLLKQDQPIRLYLQGKERTGPGIHQIHDLVYSVDAVGPVGVTFNLRDGLSGSLKSAHRFLSTHEMVFERIVLGGQYLTESPPLPLNDQQKRALLIQSILRSHHAPQNEAYYLYRPCCTNNCTSNPFRILDKIVDYSPWERMGSLLYRLPLNPRFYLRLRGLDSDPGIRKLVRNEFQDTIESKEIQQRKRDTVRQRIRAKRAASNKT